ncbi:hypothetical protein OA994_01550 [Candidatus Pelagibacter sp.]|jgi:hypothetical protein|nr:hypothetical protein [Candidatus Pelagibacter sp.]|tara:strand:+ start:27 stop:479 length:453 start_codon:yes stop_codon:yes gene_type:complete
MKYFILIIIFLFTNNVQAKNINISVKTDLDLNCKFEKVIIKNTEHNFVSFTNDQVERENLKSLKIIAKNPDILVIKNLSKFVNKINLEVKISNKDIILIQAFDQERNYSESAVYTRSTGELIHEITRKINSDEKEKDISFYSCKKNNQDT